MEEEDYHARDARVTHEEGKAEAKHRGGHFAMWEYPELFATELRAAFRPLRNSERGAR